MGAESDLIASCSSSGEEARRESVSRDWEGGGGFWGGKRGEKKRVREGRGREKKRGVLAGRQERKGGAEA